MRRVPAALVLPTLVLAALVLAGWGLPAAAEDAPVADGSAFVVDDAQLRWGLNDESGNRAFAPGTVNFLAAGVVPDPGSGGARIDDTVWSTTGATAWRASVGDVRIEKRRPDGGWGLATWAGLSTQVDGSPLGSPSAGTTSGHQVVLDGGTGTVDPGAGTASISWNGAFSVVLYSGMSFFTVADPRLEVTATAATLTGEVGGYASSMDDTSVWSAVPAERVVLADLPRAGLVLPTTGGFTSTPRYLGVPYDGPAGSQVRSGSSWGSFPASFVDQQGKVGAAAYWFSSGGATDPAKVARPMTLSYDAAAPVTTTATPPSSGPEVATPRTPSAPAPPPRQPVAAQGSTTPATKAKTAARPGKTTTPTSVPATPTVPTVPAVPVADAAPPVDPAPSPAGTSPGAGAGVPADASTDVPADVIAAAPAIGVPDPRLTTVPTLHALSAPSRTGEDPDHPWEWWLGSVLLLGAAGLSLHTRRPSRGTP